MIIILNFDSILLYCNTAVVYTFSSYKKATLEPQEWGLGESFISTRPFWLQKRNGSGCVLFRFHFRVVHILRRRRSVLKRCCVVFKSKFILKLTNEKSDVCYILPNFTENELQWESLLFFFINKLTNDVFIGESATHNSGCTKSAISDELQTILKIVEKLHCLLFLIFLPVLFPAERSWVFTVR